jgi:hypothetical protein
MFRRKSRQSRGSLPAKPLARRFELDRQMDVSGVSGTGVVVEGVQFSDGAVVIHWLPPWATTTVFHTLDEAMVQVEKIHGHEGATVVRWVD